MNEAQTDSLLRRTFRGSRNALLQRAVGDRVRVALETDGDRIGGLLNHYHREAA